MTSDDSTRPQPTGDAQIHPGWSGQPQASYEAGHSGGWGAPGQHDTGPLRLTGHTDTPAGASAARPEAPRGERPSYPPTVPVAQQPSGAPSYGAQPYGPGQPWGQQQPKPGGDGLSAMFDFTFARRATRALAPLLFWLVVASGVIDLLTTMVTYSGMSRYGEGAGQMLMTLLGQLVWLAVKLAVVRLVLELCVNVGVLAERADGR